MRLSGYVRATMRYLILSSPVTTANMGKGLRVFCFDALDDTAGDCASTETDRGIRWTDG